ncbi:MAG: hypothetical protein ABJB49_00790 [Nitrospirota bacterium]
MSLEAGEDRYPVELTNRVVTVAVQFPGWIPRGELCPAVEEFLVVSRCP